MSNKEWKTKQKNYRKKNDGYNNINRGGKDAFDRIGDISNIIRIQKERIFENGDRLNDHDDKLYELKKDSEKIQLLENSNMQLEADTLELKKQLEDQKKETAQVRAGMEVLKFQTDQQLYQVTQSFTQMSDQMNQIMDIVSSLPSPALLLPATLPAPPSFYVSNTDTSAMNNEVLRLKDEIAKFNV